MLFGLQLPKLRPQAVDTQGSGSESVKICRAMSFLALLDVGGGASPNSPLITTISVTRIPVTTIIR